MAHGIFFYYLYVSVFSTAFYKQLQICSIIKNLQVYFNFFYSFLFVHNFFKANMLFMCSLPISLLILQWL